MNINFKEFGTKAYWKNFISSDFWFDIDPTRVHGVDYALLSLAVLLFLVGLAATVYAKKRVDPFSKEIYKKFGSIAVTIGLLEVFWFLLRYENITYLGTHFVAALVFVFGLIWAFFVFRKIGRTYKVNIQNWHKEQVKQKYLHMESK